MGSVLWGLQRELGIGSYKTAWTLLHKLRRAMVHPGRERLRGAVEVDEASTPSLGIIWLDVNAEPSAPLWRPRRNAAAHLDAARR
jgi:hypothetical protein